MDTELASGVLRDVLISFPLFEEKIYHYPCLVCESDGESGDRGAGGEDDGEWMLEASRLASLR